MGKRMQKYRQKSQIWRILFFTRRSMAAMHIAADRSRKCLWVFWTRIQVLRRNNIAYGKISQVLVSYPCFSAFWKVQKITFSRIYRFRWCISPKVLVKKMLWPSLSSLSNIIRFGAIFMKISKIEIGSFFFRPHCNSGPLHLLDRTAHSYIPFSFCCRFFR